LKGILVQLADLKRPVYFIPIGLLLVLIVVSAVVFNPAFQKKMLLKHVGPLVDSLQLDYIHFTPWSLQLNKVAVDYEGGHFALEQGTIRYCLSSLLLLNANIKTLALKDVSVDLTEFNPPEKEEPDSDEIFPGVLASLQYGLGYTLQEVDVNADVLLPGQQSLSTRISGGGVRPKARGSITMKAHYHTGKEDELIKLNGELLLDQLTRGHFNAVETVVAIDAMLAGLPEAESASLKLLLTPAPLTEAEQVSAEAGGEQLEFTPEAIHLAIEQHDAEQQQRSALTLDGRYDGNSGVFDGGYQVTANERLVQRYIKDTEIPPTEEKISGDLSFNLADTTGDITVISDLLMQQINEIHANEKLPEVLRLENNFRLSLLPGLRLRVETIDSGLTDEESTRPLASSLPEGLDIPLQDVEGFMRQENTLLAFELPEVPLAWFDILLPDYELVEGTLTAAFEITTDTAGSIHVIPMKPLTVTGLTLREQEKPLLESVNLSMLPRISYRGDAVDVALTELHVDAGQGEVASADFNATAPLGDRPGAIDVRFIADVDMHRLVDLLAIEQSGRQSLPQRLSMDYQAAILQRPNVVTVNSMDANVLLGDKTRLLHLELLQPLVMDSSTDGTRIRSTDGQLAVLNISDIQLDWLSAFVPDTTLNGKLQRADFALTADGEGVATLDASQSVRLSHVTVTGPDGPVLKDVGISVRPTVRLAPDGTHISYRDLEVTGQQRQLLTGSGALTLPAAAEKPLLADGQLDMDLQAFSLQPVVARVLQGSIEAPMRLEASYKLAQDTSSIDLSELSANLFYADQQPRISLQADSGVRIRTQLGRRQSELGRARGNVTLTVANLTPEPIAGILAANGLSFTEANGKAVLGSDGESLSVRTIEPFRVTGVAVSSDDKPVLLPFTLSADSETVMRGDRLHAQLKHLQLTFDEHPERAAIDAQLDVTLKGQGEATWVEALTANAKVLLPALLDQPAMLPHHKLTAGELDFVATLDASGRLDSTTRVQGLKSARALPLALLEAQLNGQLEQNGSFNVSAPVTTRGKSGESDLLITAVHVSKQDQHDELTATVDSSVFYLNDILNTLNAIANEPAAAEEAEDKPGEEQQAALDAERQARLMLADEQAFWDLTSFNRHVSYDIKRLFYTDYLEIVDITGRAETTAERLSIDELRAYFHDSPIVLNSVLTFTPGVKPYDLDLQASINKFDLATFMHELDPESIPPAEGLFDVSIDAYGKSQNMVQYRNNMYFDMRMQSRDGVFRLLDPNDPLVVGSSNVAGAVGEGVSYIPTGLFGLGAVARLVNYIKTVPYDKIDAHFIRDESGDVQIKKYVVQSPEILMTAKGGISYEEGVDVMQSPLKMDAQLNLRGRGAAIFYDLDLLLNEQDKFGYWTGPEIKFWGTVAKSESNLGEIIEAAGKGAVLGGITRPISGLIGNVKYLWMEDETEPLEYTDDPQATPAAGVQAEPTESVEDVPVETPKEPPKQGPTGVFTDFPDLID
jgi:hypothetical protein